MSDDYTNALAKFLQSEKNAFAEPQRMLWPFRKDPYTGDMGVGHSMFTESLANGFKFPAKAMSGQVPMLSEYDDGKVHWSPEWMQGANDTAGLAMTGAIGLPKPQNAIGSGGGGKIQANPRAAIGSNGGPPLVDIPAGKITGHYSHKANLNEMLGEYGGDIDAVIASFQKGVADFAQSKAKGERHYSPESHAAWQEYLDDALKYKAGNPSVMAQAAPESIDWTGRTLWHGTKNEFDTFNAGDGTLGPGVYLSNSKDVAKRVGEATVGPDARRVLGVEYRGQLMSDNDYHNLFETVLSDLGKGATSATADGIVRQRMRELGYTGVRGQYEGAKQYNIFDPADTRIVSKEFYANPREGAAAAQTVNGGHRDEDPMTRLMKQYGLF